MMEVMVVEQNIGLGRLSAAIDLGLGCDPTNGQCGRVWISDKCQVQNHILVSIDGTQRQVLNVSPMPLLD